MRTEALFVFAILSLVVSDAVEAASVDTIDIQRVDGRYFTTIQDEHEIFWLAEATPGNRRLIEPIPTLIADPAGDSAAGSWRVAGQRLVYLATGTKVTRSFEELSGARRSLSLGQWFHTGGAPRQPDSTGSPLGVALGYKQMMSGKGPIAASGWLSQDRSISALYAEQPDGHLQIWSWSIEQEQEDLETRPISEERNLSERHQPGADVLEWLTEMKHLDRGWRIVADERMTLEPPMLILDVEEGLFLIDDAGDAYSIAQDEVNKIGTVPEWSEVDHRVLLREGDGASLYGHQGGRWLVLNIQSDDGEVVLPAAKALDDDLVDDLDEIVAARQDLKEEIAAVRRRLEHDGDE